MKYKCHLVRGYQVASGQAKDARFPHGTINAQRPFFKALGLNLAGFYAGTLNLKFACKAVYINDADYYFRNVKWHNTLPAEDFKLSYCQLIVNNSDYKALIYQPQAATKIEHFQADNQLEILAPYIDDLKYGDELYLTTNKIVLQQ